MFIFPAHLFNPANVRAGVIATVISGGTSLSGDETVIQTDGGGRWAIEYSGIDLDDPELERLWNAWVSYLRGGARAVLVPLLSVRTAPRPFAGEAEIDPSDLAWDDYTFPNYVRFAAPHVVASVVSHNIAAPALIEIEIEQGSRIRGGEKFSIANRGYIIERVTARDGQKATCVISPPRRIVSPLGTPVNFDWPVVQCRLQLGQNLIPDMEMGLYSDVSISFVEDFSNAD